MLEKTISIYKKIAFPDHYEFSKKEIEKIIYEAKDKNLTLLTSEKDYYRIKKYNFKEVKYIKIKLNISDEDKFLKKINKFVI